jgi:hypothetical protein
MSTYRIVHRCWCLFPLVIDHRDFTRYTAAQVRVNMQTGRATGNCPKCNRPFDYRPQAETQPEPDAMPEVVEVVEVRAVVREIAREAHSVHRDECRRPIQTKRAPLLTAMRAGVTLSV